MGIRFLGTPIEQFEQLIKEEEKVMITISCYKSEELWTANSDIDNHHGPTVEIEQVLTAQWGQQIKSAKDIFQFDGDAAKVYAVDLNKKMELVN